MNGEKEFTKGPHPSKAHYFIAMLEKHKKLLRCYTQNIDGLERASGVSKSKVRYCHGSMDSAKCIKCSYRIGREELQKMLQTEKIPLCKKCGETMKPGITFFGEEISKIIPKSLQADRDKVDLLIVIGTSLKVSPMDSILQYFPAHIPQILINKTHVTPRRKISEGFDIELIGNADAVVQGLIDYDVFHDQLKAENGHIEPERLGAHQNIWLFEGSDKAEVEKDILEKGNANTLVNEVITCDCCGQQICPKEDQGFCCNICFGFDTCAACEDGRLDHVKEFPNHSFVPIS